MNVRKIICAKKTKGEFNQLKEAAGANLKKLVALSSEDPLSEKVQAEIQVHYELIREFWGTAGSPDKQAEAYAGLGDLYTSDHRYLASAGVTDPAFAQFMNKAMKHFAKGLE